MNTVRDAGLFQRLRAPWRARAAGSKTPATCFVPGCQAPPVILVAGNETFRAVMCTPHARQWVESSACHQSRRQDAQTSLATLTLWVATTP
jgi:hypothetical protein